MQTLVQTKSSASERCFDTECFERVLMLFPTSVSSLSNGLNVRVHAITETQAGTGSHQPIKPIRIARQGETLRCHAMRHAMLHAMRRRRARFPQRHSPERGAAPPRVKTGTGTTQQQIKNCILFFNHNAISALFQQVIKIGNYNK